MDLTRSLKLTSVPSGRTLVTESYLSRQLMLSHGLENVQAVCNQRQESRSKCRVQRPTPPFSRVRGRKGPPPRRWQLELYQMCQVKSHSAWKIFQKLRNDGK